MSLVAFVGDAEQELRTESGQPFRLRPIIKSESSKLSLEPNASSESLSSPLKCGWNSCQFSCSSLSELSVHVCLHASDEDDAICQWGNCDYSGSHVRHLLLHAHHVHLKHRGDEALAALQERSECVLDPAQSSLLADEGDEPFLCEWQDCTRQEDEPAAFYRHVANHVAQAFSELREVQQHLVDGAQVDELDDCGVTCAWQGCGAARFSSVGRLNEHMRTHTGEKRFGCSRCGGVFANRAKLVDHVQRQRVFGGKSDMITLHKCFYCNKALGSERLLKDHMRSHVNHYKCKLCDMTCPTPSHLAKHMRFRHSQSKPFLCHICNKYAAKSESDLQKHQLRQHVQGQVGCETRSKRTYACHLCSKRFAKGNYLTKHYFRKHHFRWPSGHSRFRYRFDENDNVFRLQTDRVESAELMEGSQEDEEACDDPIAF